MIRKLVEYRIEPGADAAVESAIREFVRAVEREEPATTYRAYRRDEERMFVHIMEFPDAAAERAHREAPYTTRFVEELYPRCVEPPDFTELTEIR